jgi:hypothetical protein
MLLYLVGGDGDEYMLDGLVEPINESLPTRRELE